MKTSIIIASVREKCGLGKPPATHNSNESINSILKKSKGAGKLAVKDTVQLIKSEVEMQEQKIKKALIWRGEWSLAPQYKQSGVPKEIYYKMNPEKKTQQVKRKSCLKIVLVVVKWSGLLIRIIFIKWLVVCFVFARLHYWFSSSLNNFYMFLNNDALLDSSKGWWSLHTTVLMSLEGRFCLYLDIFLKKAYRLVYRGTGSVTSDSPKLC